MAFLRRIWSKWQNLLHDEKLKHKIYVIILMMRSPHVVGNKKKGKGFINSFQISGKSTHKCFHDRDIGYNPLLAP